MKLTQYVGYVTLKFKSVRTGKIYKYVMTHFLRARNEEDAFNKLEKLEDKRWLYNLQHDIVEDYCKGSLKADKYMGMEFEVKEC